MGLSQSEVADRFSKGRTSGEASNMFIRGDVLYSYGTHFPLTIRLAGGGYLHNGDRYSVSTAGHQSHARSAISGPVIPFSALASAGIGERDRFALRIIEQIPDRNEWICRCPGESHAYNYECEDGYEKHTLGGALIQHGRRYLLAAIDFETSPVNRPQFFLVRLPRKVDSVAEAYASLMPDKVKILRGMGAEIQRQGDMFFVRSSLATRDLPRNGFKRVSGERFRGWSRDPARTQGFALDRRESHLATELRRLDGQRYVRGTVRHAPAEHKMVKLGRAWWAVFPNTARQSWSAAGNVD